MSKVYKVDELDVYKISFELQQAIFDKSKCWPKEETYSLIDQIRRSSRSIGANLAEAWSKRQYPAHFKSKLTDADAELQETRHWLATASACGFLNPRETTMLLSKADELGRKVGKMLINSESFCIPNRAPLETGLTESPSH
jgi:four helix bundle protein